MPQKVLFAADSYEQLIEYQFPYLSELYMKGIELHSFAFNIERECAFFSHNFDLGQPVSGRLHENYKVVRSIIPIISNEKYDLIVLVGEKVSALVRSALLFIHPPRPYIVDIIDGYPLESDTGLVKKLALVAKQKALKCVTDDIVALNNDDYSFALRNHLFRRNIHKFPGLGVDLSAFSKATQEERKEARYALHIPENAFVLLYAAEFSPRSNHEMLIEAMRFLPKDVYLYLPGTGPLLEKCREYAEELGVLPQVSFPGLYPSHVHFCHAADIAVSSALYDSLPLGLVEALASSLPVVASDIKGNRELVRNGVNGYLYPSDNAYKFAEKIITIYSDSELYKELCEADNEFLKKYDISGILPDAVETLLF